ncbi:trichohyalin-like [Nematostella vectensis]|uniref:trichohyalin-like n=1 Tax=Nematostella vectensis TaxID=45351 RepID=UPI002076DF53|nr:trichohyalin-like [Nematostella vectensis]
MADSCLTVNVIDTIIKYDTLGGLVFLAFLLALIVGFIIGALIMRCIFREIEEHNTSKRNKSFSVPLLEEEVGKEDDLSTMKKMGSNRIAPIPVDRNGAGNRSVSIEMDATHYSRGSSGFLTPPITEPGQMTDGGLSVAQALTKPSEEEMEVELQNQDFKFLEEMEKDLRKQKNETFLQLLKMVLTFLFSKSRIDEEFKRRMLAKYEQAIDDIDANAARDQALEAQELRDTITDSTELENAIESLHTKFSKRMSFKLTELQEEVGNDLLTDSGLSEEEANQIVAKLMANVAATNKRLLEEANRQSLILHERLAKRQAMAQHRVMEKQEEKDELDNRKMKALKNLEVLQKRGKLVSEQSNKILEEYGSTIRALEEKEQLSSLRHQAELAEKLRRRREQKMRKLENEQEGEKEEFEARANQMISEGTMTAEDFLEAYHRLVVEHQLAKEEQEDRCDDEEFQEIDSLNQQLTERRARALEKKENELFKEIKEQAHLSAKEADRLMSKHKEDLDQYADKKAREMERQKAQIKERLLERRKRWVRDAEQRAMEQNVMISQQEETLKQVLDTQIGLSQKLQKQVMMEHEQNLVALNNHLQMSRMRQQKRLEQRLARRRARLADLRQRMEEERTKQAEEDPEKMKILARSQNIEYQAEVKKVEEDHQAALEDLRRRLAAETEEALKEQDDRLGKILGKLQLEVARRDDIIKRQDEAIRTLEKKFVDTVTREGTLADAQTDRILRQHQKQVDKLNENIEIEKERQMRIIREKLEMKRLKKERTIVARREQEAEEIKQKGVKTASSVLATILGERKHKQEMANLEREMKLELIRQTEKIDKDMQEQLVVELQEEEERFLATVAEASDIPENDLVVLIKNSANEAGMDPRLSKTIAKDVRKRIRSARGRRDEADA